MKKLLGFLLFSSLALGQTPVGPTGGSGGLSNLTANSVVVDISYN